ncbi:putative polyketide cyclase [Micromonospora sp. MW-13]|uniref:SaqL n=1 Tax=Micromonospora sp. Tu 6368 TaxID=428986 RepID=C4NYK3_9ACTN|nr:MULTISPECIES: aromatase/cyclase [unclassified Micromonospora]ACP19357.1 SaqL [Micromonospora sp. Tu 6368]MCX4469493.1 aromatase/cyclase [Micromonospora sp. NBC_01655]RGC65138.1 putative polyketide cyclase [Micromonospora sp. MW-13]
MPEQHQRTVEHEIEIAVPAAVAYRLIVDVENWPRLFPPTVHVDHVERSDREERIRIWATANGEPKSWTSRRRLDPDNLRVDFRQEVSTPPVGAMGGAWLIEPVGGDRCRVRLLHDYRAVDDDPEKLAWIDRAVDRNSTAELAALKANAELVEDGTGRLLVFDDTVRIDAPAKAVYDFVNEADRWSDRLPHVARVSLREDTPGLQLLEMETLTKDGSTHTTTSVRVCFPHERIVYKQIQVPALMTLHTGHWLFESVPGGVAVTSRHTVVINEANIARVLGPEAGVAEARSFVRNALSTNSLATLRHAKEHAERDG